MRKFLFAAVLTVFSVGCLDDVEEQASTIRGTYTLRTVNGSPLPYTVPGGGAVNTEILDNKMTLFSGGTYAEEGHIRTTVSGVATTKTNAESGTYAVLGTAVIFRPNSGKPERPTKVEGGLTMTIIEAGLTYILKK